MNRYRNARLVVIASTVHSEGGDWRSVYFLVRHLELLGESAPMINLGSKRSLRQFFAAMCFAPRVVVNGLGTAMRWKVLFSCLLRRNVAIYLHETEYMLEIARVTMPFRYHLLKRILARNPLLCVSKKAEALYREHHGACQTHVVYECVGAGPKENHFDPGKKHIVMVGSVNKRKGALLFSHVADLAEESHPDWQFHWVGGIATMDPIYRSDQVMWHGWQGVPTDIVKRCDLFFLSSIDDPCPLAALEAGGLGKRIVAYRNTGTAEIIEGLPGCRIFESYHQDAALTAIDEAFADGTEPEAAIREAVEAVSAIEGFAERINGAMN